MINLLQISSHIEVNSIYKLNESNTLSNVLIFFILQVVNSGKKKGHELQEIRRINWFDPSIGSSKLPAMRLASLSFLLRGSKAHFDEKTWKSRQPETGQDQGAEQRLDSDKNNKGLKKHGILKSQQIVSFGGNSSFQTKGCQVWPSFAGSQGIQSSLPAV